MEPLSDHVHHLSSRVDKVGYLTGTKSRYILSIPFLSWVHKRESLHSDKPGTIVHHYRKWLIQGDMTFNSGGVLNSKKSKQAKNNLDTMDRTIGCASFDTCPPARRIFFAEFCSPADGRVVLSCQPAAAYTIESTMLPVSYRVHDKPATNAISSPR